MTAPLMTVKDVAAHYGLKSDAVYRAVRDGMLPALRLAGGRHFLRFRPEHLEEYERRATVNAEPPQPKPPPPLPDPPAPLPPNTAFGRGQAEAGRRRTA